MSLSLSNLLSFAWIPLVKIGENSKKSNFSDFEVHFHHEEGPSETRYLELFSLTVSIFSPCQKSTSTEAPFNLFWTLTMILAIFVFWKSYETFLVQNLAHILVRNSFSSAFGCFFYWETSIYFCPLFVHFRTLSDTLTYSAMSAPRCIDPPQNWPKLFVIHFLDFDSQPLWKVLWRGWGEPLVRKMRVQPEFSQSQNRCFKEFTPFPRKKKLPHSRLKKYLPDTTWRWAQNIVLLGQGSNLQRRGRSNTCCPFSIHF